MKAKAHERRMHIWMHNGFQGHCGMMRQQLLHIYSSKSASPKAKELALSIAEDVTELAEILKVERIDPWKM